MLSSCFLDFSVGVGAFVIGLSQIYSFFSHYAWMDWNCNLPPSLLASACFDKSFDKSFSTFETTLAGWFISWFVWWCFTSHATIFQSYIWQHRCAGGLKEKLYLRSGSQRHRHLAGFFNVPVLHRHGTILLIRWFRHTTPFSRLLRHAWDTEDVFSTKTPASSRGHFVWLRITDKG